MRLKLLLKLSICLCGVLYASNAISGLKTTPENPPIPHNPFGNPLIPDLCADPSIIEVDGTFYCYVTTDGYGQGLETSGPPVVWKSKDFVNLVKGNDFTLKNRLWEKDSVCAIDAEAFIDDNGEKNYA